MTFITRLRLDAALYEPAPPRRPGQIGRPRLKGERLPNLSVVAEDQSTSWTCAKIANWYGSGERMVEMRWEVEMQEAMELIYRLQADHGGRLLESQAIDEFGSWVADAAKRAEQLSWLVAKGLPLQELRQRRDEPQLLALITFGEGLHNNHHARPASAKLSAFRGEFDPAWPVIRLLERLRLAEVLTKSTRAWRTIAGASPGQL